MSKRSRPSSAVAEAPGEQEDNEGDTLAVLGAKLEAVGRVNLDIIGTINSHRYEDICKGFEFTLNRRSCLAVPGRQIRFEVDEEGGAWRVGSAPFGPSKVEARLKDWRYTGDPLQILEEDAMLRDDIDYKLEDEEDVVRLNEQLLALGRLYRDNLVDRPNVRKRMRTLLSNMEKIQVAAGQLHELVRSSLSSSATEGDAAIVREELVAVQKAVDASLANIKKRVGIPDASLRLVASLDLWSGPESKLEDTFTPTNPELPSVVVVQGAGAQYVNGTYLQIGYFDEAAKYGKVGIFDEREVTFSIFRCRLSDNTRRWYISIVPKNVSPGTNKDIDFYSAPAHDDSQFPPEETWSTANSGRGPCPPPMLVHEHEHGCDV